MGQKDSNDSQLIAVHIGDHELSVVTNQARISVIQKRSEPKAKLEVIFQLMPIALVSVDEPQLRGPKPDLDGLVRLREIQPRRATSVGSPCARA
jgi:hypothetical protein